MQANLSGSEIPPDVLLILVLGDGALRVQVLNMATFGTCSRVDDAVDERRLPQRQSVSHSLRKVLRPSRAYRQAGSN